MRGDPGRPVDVSGTRAGEKFDHVPNPDLFRPLTGRAGVTVPQFFALGVHSLAFVCLSYSSYFLPSAFSNDFLVTPFFVAALFCCFCSSLPVFLAAHRLVGEDSLRVLRTCPFVPDDFFAYISKATFNFLLIKGCPLLPALYIFCFTIFSIRTGFGGGLVMGFSMPLLWVYAYGAGIVSAVNKRPWDGFLSLLLHAIPGAWLYIVAFNTLVQFHGDRVENAVALMAGTGGLLAMAGFYLVYTAKVKVGRVFLDPLVFERESRKIITRSMLVFFLLPIITGMEIAAGEADNVIQKIRYIFIRETRVERWLENDDRYRRRAAIRELYWSGAQGIEQLRILHARDTESEIARDIEWQLGRLGAEVGK